ncbi:MAG: carbohydrate kinase family protein [Erysipelotrichaceae bacterium]|nr:carbohydrate kinase family protein [Erysipelotrichaceae bacterium]
MAKINVFGAACVDLLVQGVDKGEFFNGNYKADRIFTLYGGDAFNESMVLKRFGCDVKLITVLGNDENGRWIKNKLEKEDIGYNTDILRDDIFTYLSIVLIDREGERYFVGVNDGSIKKLKPADIVIDDDCRIACLASLFISPHLDIASLDKLFAGLKQKGVTVCCDCSTPKEIRTISKFTFLKYVDYFFCNQKEAETLSRTRTMEDAASEIKEMGAGHVIVKCGSRGAYYDGRYYAPARQCKVIDTTGAGDSFVAGFIKSLSENKPIEECISVANLFGGKACAFTGATAWLDKELEKD